MPTSLTTRSVRLSRDVEEPTLALLAYTGLSFSGLVERALDRYITEESVSSEANLIDALAHDFMAATFTLNVGDDDLAVAVSDVERRATDPLGREHSSSQAPLTQFVSVKARREPGGRATIELVGLPGTREAGTRVFVATIPAQPGVSLTIRLYDLHPLSRGAERDEDVKSGVSR
jgi:hypothetical protein